MRKICSLLFIILLILPFAVYSQDDEEKIDPTLTEVWEPVPRVVVPGDGNLAPSDAIVLFNGADASEWLGKDGNPIKWKIEDGCMTVVDKTGEIHTRRVFGDCQLHIEFRTPVKVKGESQGRGNSGIFFMDRYELQVLDSYENRSYSNGQCGSIYKQAIPLVNACRKPGEWQTYDVVFTAPRFNDDGILIAPARMTAFQNGVLIQNNFEIKGNTVYRGMPAYAPHGKAPIRLQDHGNPVSYRNIWIREL
ncbi:DUF1080 domain-containing protein [candidate division KSB1 bacterium]|nr:DUF1080 domain-containing protein [candidate division KSB1 bacterium]